MIEEQTTVAQESIFTEEELLTQYTEASTGQRFLNYLIDAILMQYGLAIITGALLGFMVYALSPELAEDLFSNETATSLILSSYLLGIFNYLIYYTLCEKLFRGYTLGKLITGTRAIREDGYELTWKNSLLRSLSRMVPFEPFSALGGSPWHDMWTRTVVVKSR